MIVALWTAFRGLPRGWHYVGAGIAAALALAAVIAWLNARERADDRSNQEIGASGERERQAVTTIRNVEKANAAAETVRRDADAARAECLRNARNPADC